MPSYKRVCAGKFELLDLEPQPLHRTQHVGDAWCCSICSLCGCIVMTAVHPDGASARKIGLRERETGEVLECHGHCEGEVEGRADLRLSWLRLGMDGWQEWQVSVSLGFWESLWVHCLHCWVEGS